jgi:hypothetical protein
LLINCSCAVTAPLAVGAKITVKLTDSPTVIVRGNFNPLALNPLPDRLSPETVKVWLPVFLMLTTPEREDPTDTLPKLITSGDVVNRPWACAEVGLRKSSNIMLSTTRRG